MDKNIFPQFSKIQIDDIEQQLDTLLQQHQQQIEIILQQHAWTWHTLIQPIQIIDNKLTCFWQPIEHLHAVKNTKKLRQVYQNSINKLTEYMTKLKQNNKLYKAYQYIANNAEYATLNYAQQTVINNTLRDFHLAGINLSTTKKQQLLTLQQRLTKLNTKFENNLLDASTHWTKHITDKNLLTGIPQHACELAQQLAKQQQLSGWIFTLQQPSYLAIIKYAEQRELRQEYYKAYITRASDQGPEAGKWDNSTVIDEILHARDQIAQLVGYKSFAEYSLATKMAKTPNQVIDFLYNLAQRTKNYAATEFTELQQFAADHYQIYEIQPWDIAYISEKMRQHLFSLSQEQLRAYFPLNQVIDGLFNIANRLFNITFKEITQFDTWNEQIRLFAIINTKQQIKGHFYLDLFARENKRDGAWVSDCYPLFNIDNQRKQTPIAFVNCNFGAVTEHCLLTHEEVITLFHEFGHCLHHILTTIDYPEISGTNGVAWDAVELPSQLLENWCWQAPALNLFAKHYQSKEPLDTQLFKQMLQLKYFQTGMQIIRQLEFALFDFIIHSESKHKPNVQKTLDQIRQQIAVIPTSKFNRFQHSFSHIFAGGYAAGYYSYLWAEILSSDAFSLFEEKGIFDKNTGSAFLHEILEQGGAKDMLNLFTAFRGREPKIDAFLKHNGINQHE